jgi:uncharacterized membrane protein YcaP (DUF421 family)
MGIDWAKLFIPSGSVAEIVVRGTITYLALFTAVRLLPRRTVGSLGSSDVLVLVVIADAVQNGMAGEYRSITEGLALAATIFGWAALIDWIDFRFPSLHLAAGAPTPVIVDGKPLEENLRRELVTPEELRTQLRLHGLDSPRQVAKAYLEGTGQMSVVLEDRAENKPPDER